MTINCNGKLLDLTKPKIMGILNTTDDSFFDGGKFTSDKNILLQVEKMISEKVDIIDIGGYSTRPNADDISQDIEIKRVENALGIIKKNFSKTIISIDTFRSKVADISIQNGADIINDISSGELDKNMISVIAKHQKPYIMMHIRGNPKTMQNLTNYDDVVLEINKFFSEKISLANDKNINDIIIDPGFGFAKTTEQNFELLDKLELIQIHKKPILVGISRKSMIYKTLKTTPEKSLNGTSILNTIAILKGANILRVHDVKEAREVLTLLENMNHK